MAENEIKKVSEKEGSRSNGLEASFSTLVISIASSAVMALGLAPQPDGNKMEKNLDLARFNIDLLLLLKEKTKNNLDPEEQKFIEYVIHDLQLKFVQVKS